MSEVGTLIVFGVDEDVLDDDVLDAGNVFTSLLVVALKAPEVSSSIA